MSGDFVGSIIGAIVVGSATTVSEDPLGDGVATDTFFDAEFFFAGKSATSFGTDVDFGCTLALTGLPDTTITRFSSVEDLAKRVTIAAL